MPVPGISPTIFAHVFLTQPTSDTKSGLSSDDLFLVAMHAHFTKFHEAIMDSWGKFRENRKEINKVKESNESVRRMRSQEDKGKRLKVEAETVGYALQHRHLNSPG